MAVLPPIYQRYDDWILAGSTVSGTAPLNATYSLATLLELRPDKRLRFATNSPTVTFTLPTSRRADFFALPMSNTDAGSSVLTLTNGAGLSQVITVPALQPNNLPPTAIIDLRIGTPTNATRTSNVWNMVWTSNSVNVTLGGLPWLSGPVRAFDRSFLWNPKESETHAEDEKVNEYGTRNITDLLSSVRQFSCVFGIATDTDRAALRAWYQACHGRALPSLFWPDPSINDAYVGTWQKTYGADLTFLNLNNVPLVFDELSKGIPLL